MNVRSGYLQMKGFTRTIFVRPPREENDPKAIWALLVPAYVLINSG